MDLTLDLRRTDLRGAELTRADLIGVQLAHSDMKRARLIDAVPVQADLSFVDLTEATDPSALLSRQFKHANMVGVRASHANFHNAALGGVNTAGTNLEDATLARADLSSAKHAGC